MSKQALIDLRDKVEAGDRSASLKNTPFRGHGDLYQRAYNGSLDAAKALHEAVLGGEYRARLDIGRRFRCWIVSPDNSKIDAYSDTPARAWLIAILNALIAQEDGQ